MLIIEQHITTAIYKSIERKAAILSIDIKPTDSPIPKLNSKEINTFATGIFVYDIRII